MLKKVIPLVLLLILSFSGIYCRKNIPTQTDLDLFEAIRTGKTSEISRLIEKGANINIKDRHGNTPLHIAASRGNCEIMELLIKNGARVKATDDGSNTPLHDAAMNGHIEAAELLITKGANVNAKNNQGKTPIFPAAESGNLELVKLLASKGSKIPTTGYTPLHSALSNHFLRLQPDNNRIEMVEYFLSKGVDINAKGNSMYGSDATALHCAAANASKEIVKLLIEKGAIVNARAKNGETPLFMAAIGTNKGAVEALINKEADINARNNDNATPLHWSLKINNMIVPATVNDLLEVIELLLAHGADVNVRDNRQFTPLLYAVDWGNFYQFRMSPEDKIAYMTILKALLEKGADPNLQDSSGRTPLKLAEGELEVIKLLIKYGAKN